MNTADLVAIGGFVAMFVLMGLRVPLGVSMGLVGVFGFAAMRGLSPALNLLTTSPIRVITDFNLTLVPFFILMGVFATNSGMSRELFRTGNAWLGQFRGGLALSTIAACAGFAAICGSSIATAATMTRVALPEMRKAGYADATSTGVIAAGGTLGILIPPSVMMVVYAFLTETDVGQLLMAGVVPGILATLMYMATVLIAHGKRLPPGTKFDLREALTSLRDVWAVLVLFLAVIGVIYLGVATATEAAAVGAMLTMIIGILRGRLGFKLIMQSLVESLRTSVSLFSVLIGAILFGYFLAITQSPQKLTAFLVGMDLGPYGTLTLILVIFFIAGALMDEMAMIILLVPIVFPVITHLGFDPIWFGVIIVVSCELGMITPPVGINVFVINSIAKDVKITTIYGGVMPFILTDIIRLILLVLFPAIALWLPTTMR
ncbi:TrapT family, dctM subunit, C4-dicarboxylate transport [Neorhizobium galegae bv. officinalis bv. officinalis str. HAMBI 1141]|uniref:TRAP transporter large permease protein n=1 Tax=Neorhizobium galegae bv. officinalis bv. officinalis str. HAMBI 1141 TaxID=1028801 RepID=A0A068T915_NEOGA|nr:TRAP transporter permease [Neorhizobium galegae]CDN54516.1 TrapT family, dctM subunit, C4-dicarboxylate transport [Neorhizobium galegae bv. officinalis bv. officinalis str. HAMBI 1141]